MGNQIKAKRQYSHGAGMIWVLLGVGVCYGLMILPVIYATFQLHSPSRIGRLWGFVPNQFLFSVLLFPLASFYTFLALPVLVVNERVSISLRDPGRLILVYWPAAALLALAMVWLITI